MSTFHAYFMSLFPYVHTRKISKIHSGQNILAIIQFVQWIQLIKVSNSVGLVLYGSSYFFLKKVTLLLYKQKLWSDNQKLMIWATVRYKSYFCWLFRASLSLAANNKSYFHIDHLVMSMCRVVSSVVGRRCLLWTVCSLGRTLLAFSLLHFVLQGQSCPLLQASLDFLLLHYSPLSWKVYLSWW